MTFRTWAHAHLPRAARQRITRATRINMRLAVCHRACVLHLRSSHFVEGQYQAGGSFHSNLPSLQKQLLIFLLHLYLLSRSRLVYQYHIHPNHLGRQGGRQVSQLLCERALRKWLLRQLQGGQVRCQQWVCYGLHWWRGKGLSWLSEIPGRRKGYWKSLPDRLSVFDASRIHSPQPSPSILQRPRPQQSMCLHGLPTNLPRSSTTIRPLQLTNVSCWFNQLLDLRLVARVQPRRLCILHWLHCTNRLEKTKGALLRESRSIN